MPDIDLEPHEYGEKGKKEPILHPNWKWGLLALAIAVAFKALIFFAAKYGAEHAPLR